MYIVQKRCALLHGVFCPKGLRDLAVIMVDDQLTDLLVECIFSAQRRRPRIPVPNLTDGPTSSSTPPHHIPDQGRYQSPMMFPSIASSSESYERQSRYNSPSRPQTAGHDGSHANDMPMVTATEAEGVSEIRDCDHDHEDGHEDGQGREVHGHNHEHTLARIAHVMANGTVSRYPSPGVTILSPADGRPIVSRESKLRLHLLT